MNKRSGIDIYLGTFASNVLIQACTVLQAILLARYLGASGRGELATVIFWPTVFASLGIFGVNMAIARLAGSGANACNLVAVALRSALITGCLAAIFCGSVASFLIPQEKHELLNSIYLFLFFIPLNHIAENLNAIDQGEGNFLWMNITRLVIYPVYFLGLLYCWKYIRSDKIFWVVASLLIANLSVTVIRLIARIRIPDNSSGSMVSVKTIFKAGIPFVAATATSMLFLHLDKGLLIWRLPAQEIGWYVAAVSVAGCVNLVSNALGMVQFSTSVRSAPRRGFVMLALALRRGVTISVLGAAIFFSLLPWLIPLVYGKDFTPAISIARILLLGQIFSGLGEIINQALYGQGRPMAGMLSKVIGLCIVGSLGVILSVFGANGIACAYVAGEAVVFVGLIITVTRHYEDSSLKDLILKYSDFTSIIDLLFKKILNNKS